MGIGIEIPNEVLAKCIHTTTEMYFDLVFLLITSFITTLNSGQAWYITFFLQSDFFTQTEANKNFDQTEKQYDHLLSLVVFWKVRLREKEWKYSAVVAHSEEENLITKVVSV